METDNDKELVVRKMSGELELSWTKQPSHATAPTIKNPLAIIYQFDRSGNVRTLDIANSSKNPTIDREALSLIRKLKFKLAATDRVTPYKYPFLFFISLFIGDKVYTDVFRFVEYKGYETLSVGDWPVMRR
jgi:TonB family protein